MNFLEARATGRPFRRRHWLWWATDLVQGTHRLSWKEKDRSNKSWVGASITVEDLLADDWETQELAVTITAAQYWEAVRLIALPEIREDDGWLMTYESGKIPTRLADELARKLGLATPPTDRSPL